MRKTLSIVVPAYNEALGIGKFHKTLLKPALKKLSLAHEIIYINDGSYDETLAALKKIAARDKTVKVINFSRNFGKEIATTAGICAASGDATIIMDADGEHPPRALDEFVKKWENGAQVVIGVRKTRQKEGFVKKAGSKVFYKLFNKSSGAEIVPGSTDFRLIDRAVQREFIRFSERNRITRGLIDWLGFGRECVYFDAPPRLAGEPSYKTSQLINLALNSFVSLSLRPLFLFGWVGVVITILALLLGLFILVEQFILGDPLALNFTGPALLGILISFLVGLVLMSQGIIAIYLSHVHKQSQARPLYVIDYRNSVGLNDSTGR